MITSPRTAKTERRNPTFRDGHHSGHSSAAPLLQATRTVPIVFAMVQDAVAAGFVDSLARPGGNATGFTSWEFSMGAKWLELLKQIAPWVTRVAVLRPQRLDCLAGHIGFELANPSASYLIVIAWQLHLRWAQLGWRRHFACQLYDAHLQLGPRFRKTILKCERRTDGVHMPSD
jgi:hypothetical protein